LLCSDEVMASPKIDPSTGNYYPFTIITDASETAVGAVLLQQQGPDKEDTKVIGYSSSKFKQAERTYSVHEKELLGVLLAVQQWNCFLEGSKFTVYTNHSSLVWLNKLKEPSRRQSRWVDILQGHDFEVLYVKGEHNPADAFTRVPWEGVVDEDEQQVREPLIVLRTMSEALQEAGVHLKVMPHKLEEWKVETERILSEPWKMPPIYRRIVQGYAQDPDFSNIHWLNRHQMKFKNGLFYRGSKIAIPDVPDIKRDILIQYHDGLNGGHLGIHKTVEKVSRIFWWPTHYTDIENHVKTCPACQVSKNRCTRPVGHTHDIQVPTSPWEVVHVDFAGPFKFVAPGGYNRIVIFTDSFTKLSVFMRCKTSLTSEQVADLYIEHIWKTYGRAGQLVSDNEPILCADAWVKVHEKLGTHLKHISAYNAKANGAAEVMVKQLKGMLRAYEVQGLKWWKVLAACQKCYNDSVHSATGFTPFYMNFGRHPYTDKELVLTPLEQQFVEEFVSSVQSELARIHELAHNKMQSAKIQELARRNAKRTYTPSYQVGDYAYLETSLMKKAHTLAPLRSGPFRVTQVCANGNSIHLEGFRRPFNVDKLSPVLCLADGSNNHLTRHCIDTEISNNELNDGLAHNEEMIQQPNKNGEQTAQPPEKQSEQTAPPLDDGVEQTVQLTNGSTSGLPQSPNQLGYTSDSTPPRVNQSQTEQHFEREKESDSLPIPEEWEVQPVVRIVPSSIHTNKDNTIVRVVQPTGLGVLNKPEVEKAIEVSPTQEIPLLGRNIMLPSQLPADIQEIVEEQFMTRNTSVFTCLLTNGAKCKIRSAHLLDLVGRTEYERLVLVFKAKQSST